MSEDDAKSGILSCAWGFRVASAAPGFSVAETSMVRSVAGWRLAGMRFPPWRPRRCPMRPCPGVESDVIKLKKEGKEEG